jgi:flagellar hook-associated protein 1 FlgK
MSLFGTLVASAGALRVFEKALETTQNNVSNASTPNFAKQRLLVDSLAFEPDLGLPGGILSGGLDSYRDQYSEQAVWRRQEEFGHSQQLVSELARIEAYFDITGGAGVPGALNRFFQSVSSWSVVPNDAAARASVIEQAGYLAARVRDTAQGVAGARTAAEQQIHNTVDSINHLAGMVRDLNAELRQDYRMAGDPGFDARLHTVLEQLAEVVNFTTLRQPDGTVTILMGGQTPLVIGDRRYEIAADTSSSAMIVDTQGVDVTAQASRGRLGALLQHRNTTLPAYLNDLNRLAAALADRVNAVLASGVDSNNQPGAALFTYDATVGAALSLRVTSLTAEQLAAALPAAPGGNANVLNLMELANTAEIDGTTFMEFYGAAARNMGRALETAREDSITNELLLLQARAMREETSGVSLDEEAIHLMEFQRAYQASARLVTVLDELTEVAINLIR